MGDVAIQILIITLSVLSLGIFFVALYWLYHKYFITKIRYVVYVDDGMRLRACTAEPVEMFSENGEEWLRLRVKCLGRDVVVPRRSFRVFTSRLKGSWIAYLVNSKGTPMSWGADKIDKALSYETYRKIQQEQAYMQILAGILRYDVIKMMLIVVIAAFIIVAIAIFYRPPPEVIIKEVIKNVTVTGNQTAEIPPPPG